MFSFLTRKDGAAAVEFALVIPIFLLMIAGIIFYGLYFSTANAVQQIAAEAARATVAGLSVAERKQLGQARAAAQVGLNPLLDPTKMTVTVAENTDGVKVTVRYDTSSQAMWAFGGLVPTPGKVVERVSVIATGG